MEFKPEPLYASITLTTLCHHCGRPIIGTPMKMGGAGDAYHAECTLPPDAYHAGCTLPPDAYHAGRTLPHDGTSLDGREALLAEIARLRRVIVQYQGTPQEGSSICPHCDGAGVMESPSKEEP